MTNIRRDMAITVRYWAAQAGATGLQDLDGIDDFRNDLDEDYVALVKGRPGGLGGLYHLSVEIVSTFALSHIVRLLLDGIAFDLIKEGTKAFVLRPFLTAYKKLRDHNKYGHADIEELRLIFQDPVVIIDGLGDDSVATSLAQILRTLATNYSNLLLTTGERPYEIHIPVFEDPAGDRPSRFRVLLEVDETIPSISVGDYYKLWGLWYDFSRQWRTYDVSHQLLMDEGIVADMKSHAHNRFWKSREQAIVDHSLGPGNGLLGRLTNQHQRAVPTLLAVRHDVRRTYQRCHVQIVAAGMHHRDVAAGVVLGVHFARIGKSGLLFDRKRVQFREPSRFRVLLEVDETIPSISVGDYYKLWGLWYDFSRQWRTYDVSHQLLMDEGFMSRQEYWAVMEERWKEKHASE